MEKHGFSEATDKELSSKRYPGCYSSSFSLLLPLAFDCVITRIKNSMSACRNSPKASYNIYDCRII